MAQPIMANCVLKTIGTDVHIVNRGSGDCPILLRNAFAGNNQLVEYGQGSNVTRINIQTQALAEVGNVWLGRPNEILLKCAGGTPSVRRGP
jgi:hypothetical protein